MTATEEFMAFLGNRPYLFYLIRDKSMMKIIKELDKGGKTTDELVEKFKLSPEDIRKKLDNLVKRKTLGRIQERDDFLYYLDLEGRKMLELYKKSKEET